MTINFKSQSSVHAHLTKLGKILIGAWRCADTLLVEREVTLIVLQFIKLVECYIFLSIYIIKIDIIKLLIKYFVGSLKDTSIEKRQRAFLEHIILEHFLNS